MDMAKIEALIAEFENRPIIPTVGAADTLLLEENDMPWLMSPDGSQSQLLQVDLNQGLWVVKNRFMPGFAIDKHYHTGSVFAVTLKGEWYYKEYPDQVNKPGSYLFEPAGSVHTLMVPEKQEGPTEVWFAIYGANINMDADGNIISVIDAHAILDGYTKYCDAMGENCENLIVNGEQPYKKG